MPAWKPAGLELIYLRRRECWGDQQGFKQNKIIKPRQRSHFTPLFFFGVKIKASSTPVFSAEWGKFRLYNWNLSTPSNFGMSRCLRRRETFYEMDPDVLVNKVKNMCLICLISESQMLGRWLFIHPLNLVLFTSFCFKCKLCKGLRYLCYKR